MDHKQSHTPPSSQAESIDLLLTTVRELLNELQPGREGGRMVSLDSSLDRDLGLDSLGRVELMARLEKRFHCSLPEQVFGTAETPRDFLRYVTGPGIQQKEALLSARAGEVSEDSEPVLEPLDATTLNDVLARHAEHHPDRIHIRFYSDSADEDALSYGQLFQGAQHAAAGMQRLGLKTREAVMLMLPSGREYFFCFFGALLAGGIPVPVYPPGNVRQVEEHLLRHAAIAENSGAVIMVTMEETVRFSRIMKSRVSGLRNLVTFAELCRAADDGTFEFLQPVVHSENIAFLQYTSGSTGMPKGVALTHANLLANVRSMGRTVQVSAEDVFVSWLPLYHDMGLIGAWLGSLYFGCRLNLMSPLNFIARPIRWLRAISRYGGTLSAAPNFAYELCVRRIEDEDLKDLDLSTWRIAFNGAEAVSPQTIDRFTTRFASCGFNPKTMTPVYGLAENSVGLAFPPLDRGPVIDCIDRDMFMESGRAEPVDKAREDALHFVGCGMPLTGHQIRVVDARGRELPDRCEGRVQFQGPSATSGYYRNPEKNRELFDDKWLNTGDRGYFAEGELFVTGRSKDLIIRAGRNIYPEEIEEAVGTVDGIRSGNVAVFGISDPGSGTERLVVLAESRKKESAWPPLINRINGLVTEITGAPPDEVVIAPPNTVLKTSSGKIRRGACKEIYRKGVTGKPARAIWFQVGRFWLTGIPGRIGGAMRYLADCLYAGYCWILFGLGFLLGAIFSLIPGESTRRGVMRWILKLLAALAGWRILVSGRENLPSEGSGCVFVCNHASYLDGFVLLLALPRMFSFVAKAELRKNPIIALLLNRIGTEYVERFDRKKGVEDSERLRQRAISGRSLLYFAEGTFVRMPGLLPFRMGAFETAAKAGLPLVPVAIRGTRSMLRADSWFPRRGVVQVMFGQPLLPETGDESGADHWGAALSLRDQARKWILAHCGEPDLKHERPTLFASAVDTKTR